MNNDSHVVRVSTESCEATCGKLCSSDVNDLKRSLPHAIQESCHVAACQAICKTCSNFATLLHLRPLIALPSHTLFKLNGIQSGEK